MKYINILLFLYFHTYYQQVYILKENKYQKSLIKIKNGEKNV